MQNTNKVRERGEHSPVARVDVSHQNKKYIQRSYASHVTPIPHIGIINKAEGYMPHFNPSYNTRKK